MYKGIKSYFFGSFEAGTLGGTRTPNPLIRSQMLYPIELPVHRRRGERILLENKWQGGPFPPGAPRALAFWHGRDSLSQRDPDLIGDVGG